MEKILVITLGLLALGASTPSSNAAAAEGNNVVVWVEDAVPAGAQSGSDGGDSWNWTSSNPSPFSGSLSQQSSAGAGLHEHYFSGATQALSVQSGDTLFAAVYIDPANVPGEVMLQWCDQSGSWEHRAYWGSYLISYGANGTASSYNMGQMPAAGQWTLLTIPASDVGLNGATVTGMAFSLFNGRAHWDYAGDASSIAATSPTNSTPTNSTPTNSTTSTTPTNTTTTTTTTTTTNSAGATNAFAQDYSTNAVPGLDSVDDMMLQLPKVGDNALHILTPTILELDLITSKALDPAPVTNWNLVNASSQLVPPAASAFAVTANGQTVAVSKIGFKRRPIYAPMTNYDLRVADSIYLELATPIADNQIVQVLNTDGTLWASNTQFVATANPLRFNPAIHVNQEGYLPSFSKQGMAGYYLGSLGEMPIPASAGFELVDANSGAVVFQGPLTLRPDVGYEYTPLPYQQVYQADFSAFSTPGQYRLVIPGLGGSMPFRIDEGIGMCFARAYALGLYHQRCGADLGLPYTRFQHDACHVAPASVPMPASSYGFSWTTISNYAITPNTENPPQIAKDLTGPQTDLFPFVNQGAIDVSGGHHDAGDYSKYTINSASLVHYLMFEVDSLPGVAKLDNLGIPESGDGVSDVMQEAKWESDFLAKMQDADGGFYFLVYPTGREYEGNVTPEHGDPQVVWPKTTSVSAAATAALAQCASSPAFKKAYPAQAALYLQKAQLGWKFLTNAVAKYGKNGASPSGSYQKITSYGDDFADSDELAWAACEMFLATGDENAHQMLLSWFNPANPATWRWGWWHMSESYGNCIRSYAFAVQSGRVASASQLNATFLAACQAEVTAAGNDVLAWSQKNAYGTSFPPATKAVESAGWYFSADQAFDMVVAYQLNPNPAYMTALLANMNYEGGCNPVNASYITGLGWKRQHGIVSQWELNDIRAVPPSGIPIGNIQSDFEYLWDYNGELEELSFPSDGAAAAPYPFYDRWADSWNVTTEMVVLNQARGLGSLAFLAAQTAAASQPWKAVAAQIVNVPTGVAPIGSNITVSLQAPGLDLSTARITWEANAAGSTQPGQQLGFGQTFTYAPSLNGMQWIEAEAQFPDGRRVFATNSFMANSPNIVWVEDALPGGAVGGADGGDAWNWISGSPTPYSGKLAQQSAIESGEHQVYFANASQTLSVGTNAALYAWIYLDPAHPPTEAMLQWNDSSGSWEHRAYWGANVLAFGVDGTATRTNMGLLPAAGQWVQLKVPSSLVNLAGSTVSGLAFTLYGGRATWDCAGVLNSMTGSSNPALTVSATTAIQLVAGAPAAGGTFTFSLTTAAASALNIGYTLGGSAAAGVDYQVSPSTINIPAGANSATLTVAPISSTNITPGKNIVLTLNAGSGYAVGSPGAATIILPGNTIPAQAGLNGGVPAFTWISTAGAAYRVFYKNNLDDSSWLVSGPDVTASGTSTTWTDPNASHPTHRFYVVMPVQ
ncbi:MAG TPA: glycoside hydrolase family 9 protein [Verrucomicrobiae bacterium]|jgi:hypothetical protein